MVCRPDSAASMAPICVASVAGPAARVSTSSARAVRSQRTDALGHAGFGFDREQRGAIGQFNRGHRRGFQRGDRAAGGFDIIEQDERTRLVRVVGHGAVGDLGDEAERALRADHQMGKHVERVGEVNQRVQAVAGGVLHAELVPDAPGQFDVVACGSLGQFGRPCTRSGRCTLNAARLAASRVSSTVPSARTTRIPANVL